MLPDNLSLALTILVGSSSLAFFRFMHSLSGKATPKTEDEAHAPRRAAIVFLDHLLSGVAEENEKIQVAIDRLLPVREFIESDESSDRRIDRTEPNLDVEEARLTVVEALYGSDSQRELIRENLRLKGELFYLEKAAELLGSVEISNGIGGKATLSLRDGHFVHQNGIPTWFLAKNRAMYTYFDDLASIGCVVSGVPLQGGLISEFTDYRSRGSRLGRGALGIYNLPIDFCKRFHNEPTFLEPGFEPGFATLRRASLYGRFGERENPRTRFHSGYMLFPFETVKDVLNVLGIYDGEDA